MECLNCGETHPAKNMFGVVCGDCNVDYDECVSCGSDDKEPYAPLCEECA